MSLSERVRRAELEGSANGIDGGLGALGIDELRKDIQAWMPFEELSPMMIANPQRARNELKAACRQALSDPKWESLSGVERRSIVDDLVDVVFGMGPIEAMVADESITEIMVNGPNSIFYEREGKLFRSDMRFEDAEQVRVLIDRIISPLGRRIDESSPMVDARLPEGQRVNAVLPPIALDGPYLTIRAFSKHVITLEEMVSHGSITEEVAAFFEWAVKARKNIVVSGGTGSGKTTMLNALSCLIPHEERIVTIEDSAELRFHEHPHVVRMEARPMNAEGYGEVTIRDLVINSLRMRPDRIIVGECRGGEALDMLQAMNTGHSGSLTTLHCNGPEEVAERMVTMVRYVVDLPVDAIEAQIGSAFDFIAYVSRSSEGSRYLESISEVGFDKSHRRCDVNRIYERKSFESPGNWADPPKPIEGLEALDSEDAIAEEEVRKWEKFSLAS